MLMKDREKEKRRAKDWDLECPLEEKVQKMNSEGVGKWIRKKHKIEQSVYFCGKLYVENYKWKIFLY